jgi:catechol 2,3-dioxygenase-like lactoylglutathione lyase family enzyme
MGHDADGMTIITQVGIVVRDVEAAARKWAAVFGREVPAARLTDGYDKTRAEYAGQPTEARARLAFLDFGQVQIELIEPVDGPSTWRDHLEQHGGGLHHIAFKIKGMTESIAYLEGHGISLIQRGEYTGGRYAYLDGAGELGTILELLEND